MSYAVASPRRGVCAGVRRCASSDAVYVLRCTARLRRDVQAHLPAAGQRTRSRNALGDWFANRLNYAQQRYIIVTNSRTLLSLIVPARDPAALAMRIVDSVDVLLRDIGVSGSTRAREVATMTDPMLAPANDASVVASMHDAARRAWGELYDLPHRPGRTLHHINLLLAGMAVPALGHRTPTDAVLERLGRRAAAHE